MPPLTLLLHCSSCARRPQALHPPPPAPQHPPIFPLSPPSPPSPPSVRPARNPSANPSAPARRAWKTGGKVNRPAQRRPQPSLVPRSLPRGPTAVVPPILAPPPCKRPSTGPPACRPPPLSSFITQSPEQGKPRLIPSHTSLQRHRCDHPGPPPPVRPPAGPHPPGLPRPQGASTGCRSAGAPSVHNGFPSRCPGPCDSAARIVRRTARASDGSQAPVSREHRPRWYQRSPGPPTGSFPARLFSLPSSSRPLSHSAAPPRAAALHSAIPRAPLLRCHPPHGPHHLSPDLLSIAPLAESRRHRLDAVPAIPFRSTCNFAEIIHRVNPTAEWASPCRAWSRL